MWCALGWHRWGKWAAVSVKVTRYHEEYVSVDGRMIVQMKPLTSDTQRQHRECACCGLKESKKIVYE